MAQILKKIDARNAREAASSESSGQAVNQNVAVAAKGGVMGDYPCSSFAKPFLAVSLRKKHQAFDNILHNIFLFDSLFNNE